MAGARKGALAAEDERTLKNRQENRGKKILAVRARRGREIESGGQRPVVQTEDVNSEIRVSVGTCVVLLSSTTHFASAMDARSRARIRFTEFCNEIGRRFTNSCIWNSVVF